MSHRYEANSSCSITRIRDRRRIKESTEIKIKNALIHKIKSEKLQRRAKVQNKCKVKSKHMKNLDWLILVPLADFLPLS